MKRYSSSVKSAAFLLALTGSLMALGDVVYENDFSTRTSSGAVPYGDWREVDYSTGSFLNDDYNDPFSATAIQDGWIRGRNSCNCPTHIVDDNGNPEVMMHNASSTHQHVIIKHRIGNTFTTGTVTAQCDFRAPTTWTGYSFLQDFVLGDENYFSHETETGDGGNLYCEL